MPPKSTLPSVCCACGCGRSVPPDRRGRERRFARGHHGLIRPTVQCLRCHRTLPRSAFESRERFDSADWGIHDRCADCRAAIAEERARPLYIVDPETHCWNWARALSEGGYGKHWVDGKTVVAHRWMYEETVGPIPEGLHLDHLCRNRPCINPQHLEPVTPTINKRRGAATRLSDDDIRAIRTLNTTETQEVIAARFGVSRSLVSMILSRKRGANVA